MGKRAFSRRTMIASGLAAGAALPLTFTRSAWSQPNRPVIVVELYTSQGCNSCPPADSFFGNTLARRADVLALSFHVDYWDYIGWKDPFASPENTARQRGYAKSLRQRYVYTPEMVVHGAAHDSGLDQSTVLNLIETLPARLGPQAMPPMAFDGDGIKIAFPALDFGGKADLWMITFDKQHRTKVERGENRGRELTNYHVVRSLKLAGQWDGAATSLRLGPDMLGPGQELALLVQKPEFGPMVGCSHLARVA
jgi:hypothetical protein